MTYKDYKVLEAPEQIWVKTRGVPKFYSCPCEDMPLLVKYTREDLFEAATDRIEELECKLAEALEVAGTLSGCVEYDYHGDVKGQENAEAIATLEELSLYLQLLQ